MNKETNKGLLGITTLGLVEGAGIGVVHGLLGGPAGVAGGSIAGGLIGGASAFGLELSRRKLQTREQPKQMTALDTLASPNTLVDVTVETQSVTQRTDVPEEEAQPIIKSNMEQAAGVSVTDLSDALASMHARTLANVFPTWQTTLQEKTTASAVNTSAYEHRPQRTN